jgi:[ribosomal protein S18]-alanine N-acetyltransferase
MKTLKAGREAGLQMAVCSIKIMPMDADSAGKIVGWRYPGSYSLYDLADEEDIRDEMLNGTYYSAADETGEIVGFFCFGASAQVPEGKRQGLYEDGGLLDIGLGMKPGLCGRGRGLAFLQSGMAWAGQQFQPGGFRLTVAAFNQRAIAVYARAGYQKAALFQSTADKGIIDFWVMTLK